ncbi:MAG TPA: glycosyltransferase [Actinocrinis sp.]|uniref:glycosyltransferase n=1 Tax=Actinocrinis sp. TaxID=1920516 RepID=UPI002D3A6CED|nr:glycosyltransferase [Actinocrinis sp.]HZU58310.1 glycosyltransferase [Actinocrinis sp.]
MTALVFAGVALLSLAIWLYLLLAHGRYWLADQYLPARPNAFGAQERAWPDVVAIVPARDEADMLPLTLPTLLGQDYPGKFSVVLVDDASSDGTSEVAEKLAAAHPGRTLHIVHSDGPPPGWAGKVAAMRRGFEASVASTSSPPEYVLFTDADIAHPADGVRRLVAFGEARELDLVSLMARLRTETAAERAIVPAFVYSFAQLYPFARVNRPSSRTAAAAGGCMLVRRNALIQAGGLEKIAGARIDDVALGTLLKRRAGRGRTWLGLTTDVRSVRPYPRFSDLWDMIARSAYTQLRYSPYLLAGTLLGLLIMYAVPPVLGLAFLGIALAGGGTPAAVAAGAALAAWASLSLSYLPTLRLYRLRSWRAPLLPGVMMLYGAMTFDSARRYHRGSGGRWKGRVEEN